MKQDNYILVNIYAQTKNHEKERLKFLESLYEFLSDYSGENIIMGGDFKTILDPDLEKRDGTYSPVTKYGQCIQELLFEELDLWDIWRLRNPDLFMFTWQPKKTKIQCRLDFCLISSFLSPHVVNDKIKPSIKTDHSLIYLHLQCDLFKDTGAKLRAY